MEVSRSEGPKDNFLQKVRNLANDKKIVLIFDECTSGFRETFGGLHTKFNVEPDMAIYGKAIGNGYALTAVVGKKEIMDYAQSSFISSTFWTERIGPTAALKTLEVMERERSWETITNQGLKIKAKWLDLATKNNINITTWGMSALPGFTFNSKNNLEYKTFLTQEMLKKGFLASNTIYVSTAHTDKILDSYFFELDKVFSFISECENGKNIYDYLDGPICHSGFKRLN